jgi:hypothetical protein
VKSAAPETNLSAIVAFNRREVLRAATGIGLGASLFSIAPAPALAARTRYWLACALATRGAAGDAARSRAEAEASRDAARGFGMVLLDFKLIGLELCARREEELDRLEHQRVESIVRIGGH